MAGDGGRRKTVAVVALAVVVVFGAGFTYLVATHEPRVVFCKAGFPTVQRGAMTFTLEDGGEPGPGDCDGSKVQRVMHVLGFDCKLRKPGGEVVAELEPNQPDGRCGLPTGAYEFPASWHAA